MLEEYRRRIERTEREIESWKARTTETEKLAMELTLCLQPVDTINRLWSVTSDEDKQGMVRHLIDYLAYYLDKQQIVDFRPKSCPDQFLLLRIGPYLEAISGENFNDNPVAPRGSQPYPRYFQTEFTITRAKRVPVPRPANPESTLLQTTVIELRERGISYPNIARQLHISVGTAWKLAQKKE